MEENDANPVSNKGVKDEDTELLEQDGSEKKVDDETFIVSESEDEEKSDDEKDSASKTKGKSKGSKEIDNSSDNDDDDDLGDSDDDEDDDISDSDDDEDDDLGDSDDDENEDEGEDDSTGEVAPILEKRKPLTNAQIEEMNKRIKNTGVVYLSTIPPGMRWTQVMQKLKEFGEINHSHLQEAAGSSKRRKNQVKFVEGWVEFVNKKDAKTCASQLNGRIVGGKKSGKYRDFMWNMKYLHGFKWPQLLEMMNYEKHLRNDKLKSEFTKQKKQDEKYLANVLKSNRLKRKRKAGEEAETSKKPKKE